MNNNELVIKIPDKLNYSTINLILENLLEISETNYQLIVFDLTELHFIEPRGVTLLTNLVSSLQKNGKKYTIRYNPLESNRGDNHKAMMYLRDIGFFELHGFKDFYGKASLRSTMLPIQKIKTNEINQWNDYIFLQYLRNQTMRSSEFSHIRVAIEEIFNNIADHSTERIGCSAAQYYPRKKEVSISFSDFGIGIPTSLRNDWNKIKVRDKEGINLNDMSDSDLIEFAVKEGVSTQSKPGNRGAGLMNIIRSLTNDSVGRVYIRSNFGEIWYGDKKVKHKNETKTSYPGTFYDIILNVSNESLYDSDLEEEFEW